MPGLVLVCQMWSVKLTQDAKAKIFRFVFKFKFLKFDLKFSSPSSIIFIYLFNQISRCYLRLQILKPVFLIFNPALQS